MWDLLIQPFNYKYMIKAIIVSGVVSTMCAIISAYLILKSWSLLGDALSHTILPGVVSAYILGLPYALGAFFTSILAMFLIRLIGHITKLKEDAIIGFVFSTFLATGLLILSLNPTIINIQTITFGNILSLTNENIIQIIFIIVISFIVFIFIWKDLLIVFFDEIHAHSIGINVLKLKIIFFIILTTCIVTALQAVGMILVIAMVITPGATAYLLTDKFKQLLIISIFIGLISSTTGVYISYFINGPSGSIIVTLQTLLFLIIFFIAPKYGLLRQKKYKTK